MVGQADDALDIVDAFRAAVATHPGRPALVGEADPLSYARLADQVDRTAQRLRALTPDGAVVAVMAAHSPATVSAMLAVWAAGRSYCPVDPAFPTARRAAMLAAAGCSAVLDPRDDTLTPLDGEPGEPASARPVAHHPRGPGLAYTLFTSGSTGAPKPVLTPRHAISAAVHSLRALFEVDPDDRVLQFASLNWDTCLEEILPALTSGAALVLHSDAHRGSFPRFLRLVTRERITVLDLPTAFWHELVTYLVESGEALPETVRLVVIGGEPASPARLADWAGQQTGHARLLNTYGSTETTLITHAVDLHGPHVSAPVPGGRVPIGRALPHVTERIGDDGELWIGGPALACGYRGLPAATADRFVVLEGERFFRTGDRVRRAADGVLVPLGRLDGEIKVRGVRVDPAEVEAHIAAHPCVRAVAVTGEQAADHTVLAAYVVARTSASTVGLAAIIRDHLRRHLPAHLVPSHIRVVPDLVYTPSGKVDRHRIKEALA